MTFRPERVFKFGISDELASRHPHEPSLLEALDLGCKLPQLGKTDVSRGDKRSGDIVLTIKMGQVYLPNRA